MTLAIVFCIVMFVRRRRSREAERTVAGNTAAAAVRCHAVLDVLRCDVSIA